MQLGPNMKRLREMDVADSLNAYVIVGLSACVDSDGMSLEVIGRASNLEAAASSALAVLTQNGSSLEAPDGASTTRAEGSAAS